MKRAMPQSGDRVMRSENQEAKQALESYGFKIGARDPKLNTAFTGAFMVAEAYEEGHTQEDGGGGVWCIVGDDLEELIQHAADFWVDLVNGEAE
jgi:hypothetical protein